LYHGICSGGGCDERRGQRIGGDLALQLSKIQEAKEDDAQLIARLSCLGRLVRERPIVDQLLLGVQFKAGNPVVEVHDTPTDA
jgi:hypothetical protein